MSGTDSYVLPVTSRNICRLIVNCTEHIKRCFFVVLGRTFWTWMYTYKSSVISRSRSKELTNWLIFGVSILFYYFLPGSIARNCQENPLGQNRRHWKRGHNTIMTRGANYCCIVTNKNAPDSKHFALFKTYKFPTNWCEFQNSNPGEIEKAMQRFQVNLYYICTAGRLTIPLRCWRGIYKKSHLSNKNIEVVILFPPDYFNGLSAFFTYLYVFFLVFFHVYVHIKFTCLWASYVLVYFLVYI